MADVQLSIRIDSAPAQSGAAAIKAELDGILAKASSVWGAFNSLGESVAGSLAKVSPAALEAAGAVDKVKVSALAATSSIHDVIKANTGLGDGFKSAANSADVFSRALDKADAKKAAAEIKAAEKAARDQSNAIAALTANLLPLEAAQKRLTEQTLAWDRAMLTGKISMDQWKAGAAELAARKAMLGQETMNFTGGVHNMRMVVGQAGQQMADMFIVAQSGHLVLGQLGVQVGQFLGALGPTGAIAGAAVTALGFLASGLLETGSASDKAAESTKRYGRALDAVIPIIDRYYEAQDRANNRPTNERAEKKVIDDLKAEISDLEAQYAKLQKTKKDSFGLILPGPDAFHEVEMKLLDARAALFLAQTTPKQTADINIKRTIDETTKAREQELAVVRLATTGKEREAAMLKAEQDTRAKLKSVFADTATVEAQVKAARDNAAAIYDLRKAQEDREKAARDAETARKKRARDEQEELRESLRLLQMKAQAERAGTQGKVTATAEAADFAKTNFGPASSEYKTANAAVLQAERELQREKMQLAQEAANSEIALSRVALQAQREGLDQQVTLGQISAAEKIAILRDLTQQEAALELESVTTAQQSYEQGTLAWEQAENKKLLIAANTNRQLAALDRQATADRMAQVNAWTAPIGQAMNGMVTGFLQGTNSMRQIMGRFAQSIVISYANMAAQAGMKWFNQRVVMAAWDRMFATQEVATTAAKEGAKARIVTAGQAQQTAATRAGSAARAASGVAENTGFFARVGEQIAQWLGLETSKTAQTTVSAGERAIVEATAAASCGGNPVFRRHRRCGGHGIRRGHPCVWVGNGSGRRRAALRGGNDIHGISRGWLGECSRGWRSHRTAQRRKGSQRAVRPPPR